MPPKQKGKPPPQEPDPELELPEDVRALESCPFRLNWEALAFSIFLDEGLDEGAITDFVTKTRSVAKVLDIAALAAHVDAESDLGKEISQAEQEHGASEEEGPFSIPAKLRLRILEIAFQKDKRYAWKAEFLRRRVQLEAAEQAVKELEDEVEKKKAEVVQKEILAAPENKTGAQKYVEENRQNVSMQAQEQAEADEEHVEKTEEVVALEKANLEYDAAVDALNVAKTAALKAVGRNVAPFSVQQVYWIVGCCESVDVVEEMAKVGFPLRGVLCLRDAPKSIEGSEETQQAPLPELYVSLKEKIRKSSWDMPLGAAVAVDFTVGKFLPKCNLPMCKSLDGDEEAPHGGVDLVNALAVVKFTASSYDGWRRRGRTHKLEEVEQDDSRYRILMEGVEEERASVPVILFAMVEQVCRDARDASDASKGIECHGVDGAQADAQLQAAMAMDTLFSTVMETTSHLEMKEPDHGVDPEHTVLYHGDNMAHRACGLGSGYVQHKEASEFVKNMDKADVAWGRNEGEGQCFCNEFAMDVNKVEEHMLNLYPTPGFRRRDIPQERVLGEDEADMQRSEILAIAPDDTFEDIERFRVLSSLAELSPLGIAQREKILDRKHFEQLLPSVLIQTVMKAQAEFPKYAGTYCPWNDSALVSFFCDDIEDELGCTLPCISSFSKYWSEFKKARGETPPHPDQKYSLDASATAKIWNRKYLYPSDGSFVHYTQRNVTFSKGATCHSFKGGDDACLVATFENSTAVGVGEITRKEEEEGEGGLEFTVSTPDGAYVAMSTDGTVRIRRPSETNSHFSEAVVKQRGVQVLGAPIEPAGVSMQNSDSVEVARCILSDGAIIKKLRNGGIKVIFRDGGMIEQQTEGRKGWMHTTAEGDRWFRPDRTTTPGGAPTETAETLDQSQKCPGSDVPEGEKTETSQQKAGAVVENCDDVPLEKLLGASVVDPDTQAIVTTREDLLLIISYPSGEQIVEHADGTRVTTIGDTWKVESHGLPAVFGSCSNVSVATSGCSLCWDSSTQSVSVHCMDSTIFVGCDGIVASPGKGLSGDPDCGLVAARVIQDIGSEYRTKVREVQDLRQEAKKRREEREAEAARAKEAEADAAETAVDTVEGASQGPQPLMVEEDAPIPDPYEGKGLSQLLASCDELSSFVYDIHMGEASLFDSEAKIAFHMSENGPIQEDLPDDPSAEPAPTPQISGILSCGQSLPFGGAIDPADTVELEKAGEIVAAVSDENVGEQGKEQAAGTSDEVSQADTTKDTRILASARVSPRLFVVFPSGDGFEVMDPEVFQAYCSRAKKTTVTVDTCAIAVNSQARFGFPIPLLSHGHTFVAKYSQVDRRIPPLPISESRTPWHKDTTDEDAFKSLHRPSTIRSQGEVSSSVLTIPRATGQKVKEAPTDLRSVVVFREVVEFPKWQEGALRRIQDLLASFESKTEGHRGDQEHADSRSEGESRAAASLATRLKQMPQHRLASGRKLSEDLKSDDRAKLEALQRAENAAEEERRLEAERRNKPKTPWPPKVGEFDHTPKRPTVGKVLKYAKSEEGLIAYKTDSSLTSPSLISTERLTKREIVPCSAGRVGSGGVYVSNSSGDTYTESTERSKTAKGAVKPSTSTTQARRSESMEPPASPYQNVNFDHPQYGYEVLGSHHPRPSMKSVAYSVDCQPRRFLPPMPATYTREEAKVMINKRYLDIEGDVLRVSQTAAGKLIRSKGRGLRQFQLSPAHIHFGLVEIGKTVKRSAILTNVSLEKARFHVVTPAPPLKVVYTPCLLAGGMATKIRVLLVAEQAGDFVGEIEVRSELNVLMLSCSAKVLGAATPSDDAAQLRPSSGSDGSGEEPSHSNTEAAS